MLYFKRDYALNQSFGIFIHRDKCTVFFFIYFLLIVVRADQNKLKNELFVCADYIEKVKITAL